MILGIDIGGTSVKMAKVTSSGEILSRREVPLFPSETTPVLSAVISGAREFLLDDPISSLEGIGVSATGQIDTTLGKVIGTNGKIPGYEGAEIKQEMEEIFHVPVWVLNDANAAALGEVFLGAAKGYENVLMVTLGTGVGGGIVLGGKIFGGSRGIAGEIGHFTLYQDGLSCGCGKKGCYELYAATSALVRICASLRASDEVRPTLPLNGQEIFALAKEGDKVCQQALSLWIKDIAAGLSGLIHIFNPDLLLIGGGVSAQKEWLLDPLRQQVLKETMPRFTENLLILPAALGNDAGVLGAVRFWLDQEGDR